MHVFGTSAGIYNYSRSRLISRIRPLIEHICRTVAFKLKGVFSASYFTLSLSLVFIMSENVIIYFSRVCTLNRIS